MQFVHTTILWKHLYYLNAITRI